MPETNSNDDNNLQSMHIIVVYHRANKQYTQTNGKTAIVETYLGSAQHHRSSQKYE